MQWCESVETAFRNLQSLPNSEERVSTIKYSDLERDEKALSELLAMLRLPESNKIIDCHKKARSIRTESVWKLLSRDVQKVNNVGSPSTKALEL